MSSRPSRPIRYLPLWAVALWEALPLSKEDSLGTIILFIYFKDFLYLFMRHTHTHTHRETEAETQAEGEAGSPMWDSIPRPRGHALSQRQCCPDGVTQAP